MSVRSAVLRAFDPRLTPHLRTERRQCETLSGQLPAGTSIAVVGDVPQAGRSTVAALLALAFARYHGPRVLAIDAQGAGGLRHRLAGRAAGNTDEVLAALGIRNADPTGPRPVAVGHRWLRQHLSIAEDALLLAPDPKAGEAPQLTDVEYTAALRVLRKYVSVVVTDTPVLSNGSIVPAVVTNADRVVIVGPDDERGPEHIATCLRWISALLPGPVDGAVVSVLVQRDRRRTRRRAAALSSAGAPSVILPFDRALQSPTVLHWRDLAFRTQRQALALATEVTIGMLTEEEG
jgi:MinD-like ATPase involved in chromosome partitioning or flagellar assembly